MRGYRSDPAVRDHARRLRSEGWSLREVSDLLGAPVKTISNWCVDPDGSRSRARKESYRGVCKDCGAPTGGDRGPNNAPERCRPCAAANYSAEQRELRRTIVLGTLQDWHAMYGEPPALPDWNPFMARHTLGDEARAKRWEDGGWPWCHVAIRAFGSWNAAIEAAGFKPRAAHGGGGNQKRRRVAA